MFYKLIVDEKFPLFSEYTSKKVRQHRYKRPDGSVCWYEGGGEINRAPLKVKRERPKMMKKLIRVVKRTKAKIVSVRSEYQGEKWVKVIQIA